MKAYSYWNSDRDVCVIRFSMPTQKIGQTPCNAINQALKTFYDQSSVVDPFVYTIWNTPDTQWGLMVTETMELSDEQAFALASSIVDHNDLNPGDGPYAKATFEF